MAEKIKKDELEKEIGFLKLGYFFCFGVSIYHSWNGYGAYEMLVLLGCICMILTIIFIMKGDS